MPMPKPTANESQKAFIDRCMGDDVMVDEYPDVAQRRAVCQSQWDQKHKQSRSIRRFRANISRGLEDRQMADRNERTIYGASIATVGEAKGHGEHLDQITMEDIVTLGHAAEQAGGRGIKARFTHPNMSNDGLGYYLGRWHNFRQDSDRVRADLRLSPRAFDTPHGDLGTYVMEMARDEPDAFGVSIVFEGCLADARGRLESDDDYGKDVEDDPRRFIRVTKLHAADVVDEPAANDGLFMSHDSPAATATAFLDRAFGQTPPEELREIVGQFLERYFSHKGVITMVDQPSGDTSESTDMVQLSADELQERLDAAKAGGAAEALKELAQEQSVLEQDQVLQAKRDAAEIAALYEAAKLSAKVRAEYPLTKLIEMSVVEATRHLLLAVCADRLPVGAGEDHATQMDAADPTKQFAQEYREHRKHFERLGVSEEDYIASRLRDA